MITFNRGGECFNFRIAGIAIDNNHVLLHRAAGDAFWTCSGGRAEIEETTSDFSKNQVDCVKNKIMTHTSKAVQTRSSDQ